MLTESDFVGMAKQVMDGGVEGRVAKELWNAYRKGWQDAMASKEPPLNAVPTQASNPSSPRRP